MAEVSRQEFADMCGDDVKILNVYINRNKVIVTNSKDKSKAIDTTHPLNKAFIKQRKESNKLKAETKQIIAALPKAAVHPRQHILPKDDPDPDDIDSEQMPDSLTPEAMMALFAGNKGGRRGKSDSDELGGMQKWILMKIKGDAELVTLKVEREELLLQKTAGKLLPVDLVTEVHRRYATHIFNHFESGIETIAVKFCEIMAGGDKALYARALDDCRALLTSCIQSAGKDVDEDIKRLVYDFSEKKRLG
jgi:hypothetical protein